MPNHITNELTASKSVLDAIASDDSAIDFCKIIPRPQVYDCEPSFAVVDWARIAVGAVNITTLRAPTPDPLSAFKAGDYGSASKRLEQSNIIRLMTDGPFPKDFTSPDFENFISCVRALKEYGHPSWYGWAIANWGTKWNAYSAKRLSDSIVRFQTAWSMPSKVISALAARFPKEAIRVRWADEDFGSNVGDITIQGNDVKCGGQLENDTPAAHVLALELLYEGAIPEHMIAMPDGRFEYKDD